MQISCIKVEFHISKVCFYLIKNVSVKFYISVANEAVHWCNSWKFVGLGNPISIINEYMAGWPIEHVLLFAFEVVYFL